VRVEETSDVLLSSGKKIVKANNFMTFGQQSFAQVRTINPAPPVTSILIRVFHRRDAETQSKRTSLVACVEYIKGFLRVSASRR
jgi:hypothetical protein